MADEDAGGGMSASGMMGKMTAGEMLMAAGAAWIFVVIFVIGRTLTEDYRSTSLARWVAMLSLVVLVSMYFAKSDGDSDWDSRYPWVATTAVWGILVLAVLDLLNGVVNEFSSSGQFYEITLYIAAAIAAAGAYQASQGK